LRTLVHLSDLHFGDIEPGPADALVGAVRTIAPDLIAVSGDLTQRARHRQFAAARRFLDALPAPRIVVPGNHDIPLYNVLARMKGAQRYQKYISAELEPFYADNEIAVVGLNTARSLTFKGGRINERQLGVIRSRLCGIDERLVKIVLTHHPFDLPGEYPQSALVGRARLATELLADCKVDIFLAGHFHLSLVAAAASRFQIGGRAVLLVQAGTATSNRGRGHGNSFNVLRIAEPTACVERFDWVPDHGAFAPRAASYFTRTAVGWRRSPVA
jgi:3',5'-cyclic AMP phosphodiesterase CpdA